MTELGNSFSSPLGTQPKGVGVESIIMDGFEHITSISKHFMAKAVSLTQIDISPLINVASIGDM